MHRGKPVSGVLYHADVQIIAANVPLVGAVTAMERYLPHQNGSSISSDGIPQQIP